MNKRTSRARQWPPASRGRSTPNISARRRNLLNQMTPDERRTWIQTTRVALQRKKQREQDYLDRRATSGTRTPTDEVYEQDQDLLADLLAMLDEMENSLNTHLQGGASWQP